MSNTIRKNRRYTMRHDIKTDLEQNVFKLAASRPKSSIDHASRKVWGKLKLLECLKGVKIHESFRP